MSLHKCNDAYKLSKQTFIICSFFLTELCILTSISANADGPRNAASRKIDHIVLPTKYNNQATSIGQ